MDQRANIVEQDIKDILETRLEISRKIQLIDEKARYELENMKTALSGLAETGKDFLDQSTRVLDPVRQMNARPWVVLGGVMLVGSAISLLEKKFRRAKVYPYYPPQAHGAPVMPSEGEKEGQETEPGVYPYFPEGHEGLKEATRKSRPSFSSDLWSDVKGTVQTEMGRSRDAIGYALREFTRDMAKEIVPMLLKSLLPAQSHRSRR